MLRNNIFEVTITLMSKTHLFFYSIIGSLALLALGCGSPTSPVPIPVPTPTVKKIVVAPSPTPSPTPQPARYKDEDLVSLSEVIPGIRIENPLADADNPFGAKLFKRSDTAYLRYGTAKKLAEAQKEFQSQGLELKIWTAYRPFAVQVKMFEAVGENANWVSNPYRETGKKTHVRAVAVDCTLVDRDGNELPMPSAYLDFAGSAERMKHTFDDLPPDVLANRQLLKEVMTRHGLELYVGEWWHYQDQEWERYPAIEMDEFPEIHRELLPDALLGIGKKTH